ncbi:hypothetical protein CRUP_010135 [Coryphaenoides rupestris]|nr:hypothetical protein CRUP_010135 [Coryphaenoides rupestris]
MLLGDNTLRIVNSSRADEGHYVCLAVNTFGSAEMTSVLWVKEPMRVDLSPTRVEVTVGESVVLSCRATHDTSLNEITDCTATLSWSRGLDNHSPISTYNLQARSPFSLGWQTSVARRRRCARNDKDRLSPPLAAASPAPVVLRRLADVFSLQITRGPERSI